MRNLEKVSKLFMDQTSTKVISTVSQEGEIHSIVAGSVMVLSDDTMAAAEVIMNTTSENLKANNKVAILGVKGTESYLVNGTVQSRLTNGELFDAISKKFAEMNMHVKAVWTFSVDKIFDEGIGENSGKQIF